MQREIKPEWLLRLAEELGGAGAGRGQPRNTNLRRSVSTAYYAVFHQLALAAAAEALPGASRNEVYAMARHISHSSLNKVCGYLSGATPPRHLDGIVQRLRQNPALTDVASTFIDLQQQREDADYNHLADFTKPGVLALVSRARKAVETIDSEKGSDDFRDFFGLVTLRTSMVS
ncbi:MAG: hypothetical protein KatS3mg008_2133 [Acidimicrobiales bacterium]|nr:MAG: hypothetical protein KatS3mg008_2133 [Acidimicrobiales bacterium]